MRDALKAQRWVQLTLEIKLTAANALAFGFNVKRSRKRP